MRYLALALLAVGLVSCNRDPNYLKQKYLESGNKYYDASRYKEASIMYRKAIDKDRKFGVAYYKLALTNLKQGSVASAVPALRRAVELIPVGTKESDDSILKLSEIMVVAAQASDKGATALIKEVQTNIDGLLKRNPNSWQGHKLSGDLSMLDTASKFRNNQPNEAKKALENSISEYRKALAGSPGDYVITLALGRTLVVAGETAEGEQLFKSLIDKDKKNLNGYLELYRVYVAEKKLTDAENILKLAITNNPSDSNLRLSLAQFYFGTNKRDELLKLLSEMKGNLKQFPEAYMQAGDFFMRVNQYDDAIKQYEEGIQKDSGRKTSYMKHEIEVYIRQGKMPQAAAKNDEILKIDAKDPEARGLKATLMLDKGEVNAAMNELQSVVTAKPGNFVARFNLGRAHFARQEYEQARQEFDAAIQLRPDYLPARLAQTQVALLRGDNEGAIRDADEILKISPGSVQGRVMKAAGLQRSGKYDEARALLDEVLKANPDQTETLLELGVLDLAQRKFKDAQEAFHKAYAADPQNIRGLLGESKAYLFDGQTAKSVELIKTELDKKPDRIDLIRELGNAQLSAGQFDNSIATFQNLIGKTPDKRAQADLWGRIAQSYRYKGDTQKSIDSLEKSKQLTPDSPPIMTNLAMLYEELNQKETARKLYEQTLKVDPNNPVALNNLAYLIAETNGDLDQALTYATRAVQKLPNFLEVKDTLGWIYMKKNLSDNAIDQFRNLVVAAPQNPIYHYHYAMALAQKGDNLTAKKECAAALANKPNKFMEQEIKLLQSKL